MRNQRYHFLEDLIKENNFTCGAELGVQRGHTFFHLLETCPDLHLIGVDLWLGHNQVKYRAMKKDVMSRAKDNPRATIIYKSTQEAHKEIENKSLDFVFIDADHSYHGVFSDLKNWIPKIREGGYICGHDCYYSGVKKAIDEVLKTYKTTFDMVWYKEITDEV